MQEKINKKVNRIIKIITDRNEFLEENKTFVIDLAKGFCFYNEQSKLIYTGESILHKYNSLAGETLKSNRIVNYIIGANIKNGSIDYLLHKDRTIFDLDNLINELMRYE